MTKLQAAAKAEPFKVSRSKIVAFRQCHQKYHLKYVDHLRRRRIVRPLQFGTIVHGMAEAYANADDPFDYLDQLAKKEGKRFRAEIEEYGDIIADIRCIMTDYFDYHKEDGVVYQRRKGKASEHLLEVEIVPGILLKVKIDAFIKTPNGLRWMVEHKSFGASSPPTEDNRWRDVQSAIYLRVNDLLGLPRVDGLCWDYIRSKPPSMPEILKSGELSRRGIDTLPTRLQQFFEEHPEFDAADDKFSALWESARENRKYYFPRMFTPVKKKVVDRVWNDAVATAKVMRIMHGESQDMNIGKHCSWCEYESICRAILTGTDVDYVKEKEYKHEEDEGGSLSTEAA